VDPPHDRIYQGKIRGAHQGEQILDMVVNRQGKASNLVFAGTRPCGRTVLGEAANL